MGLLGLKKQEINVEKETKVESKKAGKGIFHKKPEEPIPSQQFVERVGEMTNMPIQSQKHLSEFTICRRRIIEEMPQVKQQYQESPSGQLIPVMSSTTTVVQPIRKIVYEPVTDLTIEDLIQMVRNLDQKSDIFLTIVALLGTGR
jgi:hypothetical protein